MQTAEQAFQIAFSETIEGMVKAKQEKTGMSYGDALRAVQSEDPDFFSSLEYSPPTEKIFREKFSKKVESLIKKLQSENPGMSYAEGLKTVQGMAVELFTEYVAMN